MIMDRISKLSRNNEVATKFSWRAAYLLGRIVNREHLKSRVISRVWPVETGRFGRCRA